MDRPTHDVRWRTQVQAESAEKAAHAAVQAFLAGNELSFAVCEMNNGVPLLGSEVQVTVRREPSAAPDQSQPAPRSSTPS